MGLTTIPWCTFTWNPWRGCRKVSPGCKNCYISRTPIFRITKQKHEDRVRGSNETLFAPMKWIQKPWVCEQCGKRMHHPEDHFGVNSCRGAEYKTERDIKGNLRVRLAHRARVFLGSLMDIFDDEVDIAWFAAALNVVRLCPELDFLMVTKRPELFIPRMAGALDWLRKACLIDTFTWADNWLLGNAPVNVWMITSTENQEMLEKRVPQLLKIPAVVHGLSCEPLLGPLDLGLRESTTHFPKHITTDGKGIDMPNRINWVIGGGESGPEARSCELDWIASLVRQTNQFSVPMFVKQMGANPMGLRGLYGKKGEDPKQWPKELQVREWPDSAKR